MIVKIPEDIYSYENKLFGNFTTRIVVCGILSLIVITPTFIWVFWITNSVDLAAIVAMVFGLPILFCAVHEKDGQHMEQIIMYKWRSKFRYTQKRKFVMSNLYEEVQKNQKEYELENERLKTERLKTEDQQKKEKKHKKHFASLDKKNHRTK